MDDMAQGNGEKISTHSAIGTPEQLRDPNYFPPISIAVPLGIQHVMAMFVSNVTPAIIIAGAAGFGFGSNSPDFPMMIYMMQMCMLLAGVTTLLQTISFGPVGARLPIVQGTSFAFIPIIVPLVAGKGIDAMAAVTGGILVGGILQACLAPFIGRLRFALPPLVTGLIVTMIGLSLLKIGIQYAAGGVPAIGTAEFGSLQNWGVAFVVIVVTLALKFFSKGMLSVSSVLIGLVAGYIVAFMLGMVNLGNIDRAAPFALPKVFPFGIEFTFSAILGITLMSFISAIETVGDVSGITKGGANREATDKEIQGATYADGIGSAFSSLFGGLPNTSFSQNVGLIAMTGVMSRHVATIGAVLLVICGFIPKVGAIISTVPIEVLGGGVIIMFGMVASAGVKMLADVDWNSRNMVIFAVSISIGLGLMLEPSALQHMPSTLKALMSTGLLPAAIIAIVLNLVVPQDFKQNQ
jgi:xanthine permease